MPYTNILVTTDGSSHSDKGVDQAIALAKAFGAKLTAVHVSESYPTYDIASSMGMFLDANDVQRYYDTVDKLGTEILAKAKAKADEAGVACETRYVGKSRAADGILKTAEAEGSDAIVIASHGRRGLERLVMGSCATEVANRSKVPVVMVR